MEFQSTDKSNYIQFTGYMNTYISPLYEQNIVCMSNKYPFSFTKNVEFTFPCINNLVLASCFASSVEEVIQKYAVDGQYTPNIYL